MCMGMVQEAREEREEGERVGEDMVMEVVGRVGKAMDKEEEEREVVERVG